jgi:hypothetical protein
VHPGLTAVPAQIRGHRCAQHALVDGNSKLIGNRGGSHNSRCVNASKSTDALDAANEDALRTSFGNICVCLA